MNVEQLIRMLTRIATRRGVSKGMDMLSSGGKDPSDMTPEERAQAKVTKEAIRNGQRGMRQVRRFTKF